MPCFFSAYLMAFEPVAYSKTTGSKAIRYQQQQPTVGGDVDSDEMEVSGVDL